jgi:hypothetical protein
LVFITEQIYLQLPGNWSNHRTDLSSIKPSVAIWKSPDDIQGLICKLLFNQCVMMAWNIIMELVHVTIVHKASEQSVLQQKDVSSVRMEKQHLMLEITFVLRCIYIEDGNRFIFSTEINKG